jgi:hypothetical protein
MRLLKRLPKQVKRRRKTTCITKQKPKQLLKRGGIPPMSDDERLPISKGLRTRLSKGSPIYKWCKQNHKQNIKILEHYAGIVPNLGKYKFINYHQVTEGIIINFHYNNNIYYYNTNGIYIGKTLTMKIIMKPNAIRTFIIKINNDKILNETHDCKKSCYYPNDSFSI